MKSPPIPKNETERLNELIAINILDTPKEPDYDDITKLASSIFETPISAITLIDKDRQWFKSCLGLPDGVRETPRNISFCAHTLINPSEVFVIPDARLDERFHDNPLVTGNTNFVFYAGAPLKNLNNNAFGSLCIIDTKPREFDEQQVERLQILSNQVSKLLELRLTNEKLIRGLIEKSILLKEIHHRVKNNLQIVSSLLSIQANVYEHNEFSSIIKTSQDRIKSMALVHEKLYLSKSLSKIDLKDYITTFLDIKVPGMTLKKEKINYKINIFDIKLNIEKALPIGLIINELVTNSLKYALDDNDDFTITIELTRDKENKYILVVNDNGNGLNQDPAQESNKGIGLELVASFVDQLEGTLDMSSTENGLSFQITFEL